MATIIPLIVLMNLFSGRSSESIFRHIVASPNTDSLGNSRLRHSFNHVEYQPINGDKNHVEDNTITSNEIYDVNLNSIGVQIVDLKQMIMLQNDMLQLLVENQEMGVKENSRWLKRYKSTRRYLRKLNRSCQCKSQKSKTIFSRQNARESYLGEPNSILWEENEINIFKRPKSKRLLPVERADLFNEMRELELGSHSNTNKNTEKNGLLKNVAFHFDSENMESIDIESRGDDLHLLEILPHTKYENKETNPGKLSGEFITESSATAKRDKNVVSSSPSEDRGPLDNVQSKGDRPDLLGSKLELRENSGPLNTIFVSSKTDNTDVHSEGDKAIVTQPGETESFNNVTVSSTGDKHLTTEEGETGPLNNGAMNSKGDNPAFYDLMVDLTTGETHGDHFAISWISNLTLRETDKCGLQGVVKISFPPALGKDVQETIMIDMWFDNPTSWVFNIGDSLSNDGMSGDGTSQENDAEAEGYGTTFSVHGSDKSDDPLQKLLRVEDNILVNNASFLVTNEAISWKMESGEYKSLEDPYLFALKGQTDVQGDINYDIYVGFNRVIAGNYRSGSGLCKIAFKWLESA